MKEIKAINKSNFKFQNIEQFSLFNTSIEPTQSSNFKFQNIEQFSLFNTSIEPTQSNNTHKKIQFLHVKSPK